MSSTTEGMQEKNLELQCRFLKKEYVVYSNLHTASENSDLIQSIKECTIDCEIIKLDLRRFSVETKFIESLLLSPEDFKKYLRTVREYNSDMDIRLEDLIYDGLDIESMFRLLDFLGCSTFAFDIFDRFIYQTITSNCEYKDYFAEIRRRKTAVKRYRKPLLYPKLPGQFDTGSIISLYRTLECSDNGRLCCKLMKLLKRGIADRLKNHLPKGIGNFSLKTSNIMIDLLKSLQDDNDELRNNLK